MSVITEPQKKLITIASETPEVKEAFWLAGATALAEFYLQHRRSNDLDFFTAEKEILRAATREYQANADKKRIPLKLELKGGNFARFTGSLDGELVKVEFCVDSPYRLAPTTESAYGIQVENSIDIACNKLSALYDRFEMKDFVDVYFIHKEICELDDLIPITKQKHGGVENHMLAISFQRINKIPDDSPLFPKMLKPLDKKDMRQTFLRYAARLIQEPFEARPYSE
jgi:hypothetical protein